MATSAGYKPVGSSDHVDSHADEHAGSEEVGMEAKEPFPEEGVESSDRLLPGQDDDVWDEVAIASSRKRRRSGWLYCLLVLVGLLALFAALATFVHFFVWSRKDAGAAPEGFRRPESEYVLGLDWDFKAPAQVREYHWTIREMEANPDGVMKQMLTINGKFPGELIRCNEGDTIVVNVDNQATNATAIHFHGIFQTGTNEMDGVPGVTQCPIAPGRKFRYEFTVQGQAGTYFYHGHMAAQASDGLVGPLVVHARDEKDSQAVPYASDRVVMMQDYYYDPSHRLLMKKLSPGSESSPVPNGALINGANRVNCSLHQDRPCDSANATLPTFDLLRGSNHRLRLLNVGAFAWFEVTVDRHLSLPIVEIDGTPVVPEPEESIVIGPGQRYSVVLSANATDTDADADTSAFWFRARMLKHCFGENVFPNGGFDEARAIIRYTDSTTAATTAAPTAPEALPETHKDSTAYAVECRDMPSAKYHPSPPRPAPAHADASYYFRVNLQIGDWRLERGFLNDSSFRPTLTAPTLHRLVSSLTSSENDNNANANATADDDDIVSALFDRHSQLTITPPAPPSPEVPATVDIILQNFDEGNHPFHLHGHAFWVLASGHGYFPGYPALGLRPGGRGLADPANSANNNATVVANPVRRDVATVEGFGWLLLRFAADNPGVWLFHCHMLWHGESGMGLQIVARPDLLAAAGVGEAARALCAAGEGEMLRGSMPEDGFWVGKFADD